MINLFRVIRSGCVTVLVMLSVTAAANPAAIPKDPTRPLDAIDESSAQAVAHAPLQLSAIFMRSDARVAVINGRMLQRGDSISGITITRIESGRVHFTGSQSGVLNLYPAVIKRKL